MTDQNFKNHSRLLPIYHFIALPLILVILVISVYKLYLNYSTGLGGGLLIPGLFIAIGIALALLAIYVRSFALKAQDRAIRAEENLRYFAMTGNLLDSKLTTAQIIALRFAPNNELLDLAHRAVAENLKPSDIKKAVKHWKGDYHRV